jgi:hypothetical protein
MKASISAILLSQSNSSPRLAILTENASLATVAGVLAANFSK